MGNSSTPLLSGGKLQINRYNMSSNRKPWTERILNAATKEDFVSNSVLRRRLRIPTTEMNNQEFNRSVGRSMRHLAHKGKLKRVDLGEYTITKKGERAAYSY